MDTANNTMTDLDKKIDIINQFKKDMEELYNNRILYEWHYNQLLPFIKEIYNNIERKSYNKIEEIIEGIRIKYKIYSKSNIIHTKEELRDIVEKAKDIEEQAKELFQIGKINQYEYDLTISQIKECFDKASTKTFQQNIDTLKDIEQILHMETDWERRIREKRIK